MPKIIIQASHSDGTPGSVTLAERAVPTDLQNDHYMLQLIDRLAWALTDAEQLESQHHRAAAERPVDDDGGGGGIAGSPRRLIEVAVASPA